MLFYQNIFWDHGTNLGCLLTNPTNNHTILYFGIFLIATGSEGKDFYKTK